MNVFVHALLLFMGRWSYMLYVCVLEKASETEGFVPRAAGGAINISPSPDQTQWKNRESQKIKGTASAAAKIGSCSEASAVV
jgi:hypothetical protein